MYYTRENEFKHSTTWEYITVKHHKKQVDTGADSAVMSLFIWTELGKLQLDRKIRRGEAYNGHQLTLLLSLTCNVELNGRQRQLGVEQSEKSFLLFGRNILPRKCNNTMCNGKISTFKRYKAHVKLIPGKQAIFCKSRKKSPPLKKHGQRET